MIPFNNMTQLLKTCSEMSETNIETHQWVRVKKGQYKDDLGLVEMVENKDRALIRLIPRIPGYMYQSNNEVYMQEY